MKKNIRLKTALFEADIKQNQLAEKAGIPENIISLVVNGRYNLTEAEQIKIAQVLEMKVQELFEC